MEYKLPITPETEDAPEVDCAPLRTAYASLLRKWFNLGQSEEEDYSLPLQNLNPVSHYRFESICMDLEEFFIDKTFRVREIGFVAVETGEVSGCSYDLSTFEKKLDRKDRKSARYCTKRVRGLNLCPGDDENQLPHDVVEDVQSYLQNKQKTESRLMVSYKGGHEERDLLERLDIPKVNLEKFG